MSGKLRPSEGYEEVRPLFLRHSQLMELPGSLEEPEIAISSSRLAALHVSLEDVENGETLEVGPVFVSEALLFTCSLP